MDRFLKGAGGTISITILGSNRQPINADGVVGVTIKDGAGATVVGPVAATPRAGTTGIYDYHVTGAQASSLDVFTNTWAATVAGDAKVYTTYHEIVGAFLFSLQELQELDPELDDRTKYPDSKLIDAREWAEEIFESETGLAFRPRGARLTLRGNNSALILLRHQDGSPVWNPLRLISGSMDGVELTELEVSAIRLYEWGALMQKGAHWNGEIELYLEHGLRQVPAPVAAEAAKLALHHLRPSAIPDRAETVSTGDETFRLTSTGGDPRKSLGGGGGPTPVPSVNQLINSLKREVPAIG